MIKNSDTFISVSLTDNVFKVAQVKGGASPKLVNVAAVSVQGVSDADLPKKIQSALSGFNTKKMTVVCVVPNSMATTKNIEIPSTNKDEIKSIVSLQAGRHTPFSREEIQVGYLNNGVHKNNYTKVLLVIANKNNIKRQMDAYDKLGIKVQKILFAPEGIADFYSEALGLKKAETAPTVLIDLGQSTTDVMIIYKGSVIMSRNIFIGRKDIVSEGAGAIDPLVDELKATMDSYQSEDIDIEPSRYVVVGEDEQSKGLLAAVKAKLGWNIEHVPYVDKIKASGSVLKKLATKCDDNSFLDVAAAVTKAADAQIDLMPEEIQLKKSVEEQGKQVFVASILGFAILIFVCASLGLKVYFKSTYLKKLTAKYGDQRAAVVQLEKKSMSTRIMQEFLDDRMVSLDVINELYLRIPKEIYLNSITMDQDGVITLLGIADESEKIYEVQEKLQKIELFKSVSIKSVTSKKDRGKTVSAFEIVLKLKETAEETVTVDTADNES